MGFGVKNLLGKIGVRWKLRPIDLRKDPGICMLPFVHFHITQQGGSTPCCQAPWQEELGSLKSDTIKEIWNAKAYRKLRMEMLDGNKPSVCRRCYEKEGSGWTSLRNVSNQKFAHHIDLLQQAYDQKGKLNGKPVYFDIRFSNVCNLKCRICGPWSSSKWFEDAFEMGMSDRKDQTITQCSEQMSQFLTQVEENVSGVEEFYFAGGEPLLMEEHYTLLDMLLKHGKTGVTLTYNSNFSTLKYKGRNILDVWKKFSSVNLAVSLDGYGARLEYMRNPIKWQKVLENLSALKTNCPHVNLTVSPTISVFNIFHLPHFHRLMVDSHGLNVEDFIPTLLMEPAYFNIRILPEKMHQEIIDLYSTHLTWISQQPVTWQDKFDHMEAQYQAIESHLKSDNRQDLISEFKQKTKDLDKLRDEDLLTVFPELISLMQESN